MKVYTRERERVSLMFLAIVTLLIRNVREALNLGHAPLKNKLWYDLKYD